MSYVITQKCVGTCDTACVDVCPCDCIEGPITLDVLRSVAVEERPTKFPGVQLFIDPEVCIDCDACRTECPVEAIYAEDDLPPEHAADAERNAAFYRDH